MEILDTNLCFLDEELDAEFWKMSNSPGYPATYPPPSLHT